MHEKRKKILKAVPEIPERNFESRRYVKHIKDPVYGYVEITKKGKFEGEKTEQDFIDSEWFQRLRRIKQTQCCYLVYPGMEHTRFQHVLGVMHLAGDFARTWYSRYWHECKRNNIPNFNTLPSINYVEEVFRLAGLFHDVGHGPFSHSLDKGYKNYFIGKSELTHEHISQLIVENIFSDDISKVKRSPNGKFDGGEVIDSKMVGWLIRPEDDNYSDKDELAWINALSWIISGVYDADALDYLVRDSLHAGTFAYGLTDVERLKKTTFMTTNNIQIYDNSIPAIENLLYSRLQMYQTCYYHKTVRAFELVAEDILPNTLKLLKFIHPEDDAKKFLKLFLKFDEYSLLESAKKWKKSIITKKKEIGEQWVEIYNRKQKLKLVRSKEYRLNTVLYSGVGKNNTTKVEIPKPPPDDFKNDFKNKFYFLKNKSTDDLINLKINKDIINKIKTVAWKDIENKIFIDSPLLGGRKLKPTLREKHKINIYNPAKGKSIQIPMEKFLENIPIYIQWFRVYTTYEYIGLVKTISNLILEPPRATSEEMLTQDTNY